MRIEAFASRGGSSMRKSSDLNCAVLQFFAIKGSVQFFILQLIDFQIKLKNGTVELCYEGREAAVTLDSNLKHTVEEG